MATQFLDKKNATTEVVNRGNAAGIGIVSGVPYLNPGSVVPLVTGVNAAGGLKIVSGRHTTVAASDTVVTGLTTVIAVVATLESDPGDDPELVSASIGDQAGTPAAGSILIKTWKNGGTDPTPAAATTFSKVVNWIAIGT
jgi:hypothetical protein